MNPLEAYHWEQRVLLAFAPHADDSRLVRLLEQVQQTRAEFDDRRLVLVTVTPVGASAAGWSRGTDFAQELRHEHDVQPDAFALLLVGLDGGVKARSAEPTALSSYYRQIDSMPMRQAELRER